MTEAIDPHTCFDLDGTRVHGDPGMSSEARAAIREVIAAVQRRMGCQHCGRPPETDGDHTCPCPYSDDSCPDHR